MLLNFYVGNRDWDGHNWRAARKRVAGAGYHFFPWDTEFAISPNNAGSTNNPNNLTAALNTNVTGKNSSNRPTGLHQRLALNSAYRLHFADRIHLHMFNGGPLDPATAIDIWEKRSQLMDTAIIAESARWGDFRRDVDPANWSSSQFALYTKNVHYLPRRNYILNTYLPQRRDIVLNQLRNRNLYPDTDAPVFSQHGGRLTGSLSISHPNASGTIRYTLDGTDPTDPAALTYSTPISLTAATTIKARVSPTPSGPPSPPPISPSKTPPTSPTSSSPKIHYKPHPAPDDLSEFHRNSPNISANPIETRQTPHFTEGQSASPSPPDHHSRTR